jgi:hypothetical protein
MVPDARRIYDDILPILAFKTVKSWADTRVGDNRRTCSIVGCKLESRGMNVTLVF